MDDEMSEEEIAAHAAALAAMRSGLVRAGDTRNLGESDNLGTQRAHEATMHEGRLPPEEVLEVRGAYAMPPNDKLPEDEYDRQALGSRSTRFSRENPQRANGR